MLAEAASSDPLTMLLGPAGGAAVAVLLVKWVMRRGDQDATRRTQQEDKLVVIVEKQAVLQTKATDTLERFSGELQQTNFLVRDLVSELRARPCLHQKPPGGEKDLA